MPRDIHTIGIFDKGVQYAADNQDVDQESASYQTDVWANTDEGKLIGRPSDTAVQSTLPVYSAESFAWLQRGSIQDLVYHDGSAASIQVIQDFYGTPAKSSLGTVGTATSAAMAPYNKEVHIGLGNTADTLPKWAGYVTEGWFNAEAPAGIIFEDAECSVGGTVPFLYKIHTDGTSVWGVDWQGTRLYKIVIATGAVSFTTVGEFTRIQGFCIDKDTGYVWVLDMDSALGTLRRYNLSTLVLDATRTVAGVTIPAGYTPCDLGVTTNATDGTLWLALWRNDIGAAPTPSTTNVIFRWTILTGSGTATFADITPDIVAKTGTPADGLWNAGTGSVGDAVVNAAYQLSLTPLNATTMGWLTTRGNDTYTFYSGGSPVTVDHGLFAMTDAQAAAAASAIIEYDQSRTTVAYESVFYTGTNLYLTLGTNLYRNAVSSVPAGAGAWVNASTHSDTEVLTNPSNVTTISTDLYLTRTSGAVGIDKIETTFTTLSQVYGGAVLSIAVDTDASTSGFTASRTYFYKIAIEYDGYQLSPLSPSTVPIVNASGAADGKNVTITITDTTALSTRVTAVYVFRASGPEAVGSLPDNLYRSVIRVSMNDGSWAVSGTVATRAVNDDVEVVGVTYEALSGIPESLEQNIVHYTVSTPANGRLYVGNCYHAEVKDAKQYIFASLPGRYDVFDWSQDFLKLPFQPVALVTYAGRIWAFSYDRIARIIPDGLVLEDIYEGAGIDHPRSVKVTEQGMFFANRNNIYWHDGQTLNQIGNPILDRTDTGPGSLANYSYRTLYDTRDPLKFPDILYSSKHQYLLIFFRMAGLTNELFAWGYHITKQRWDFFTFPDLVDASIPPFGYGVLGFKGEVYYSTTSLFHRLFDVPAARIAWTWVGNRFTGGTPDQTKKFYEVKSISSGTAPTITYSVDEGTYASLTGDLIATADRLKKSIRVKIVGAASTAVNAVSIIYRNLVGYR